MCYWNFVSCLITRDAMLEQRAFIEQCVHIINTYIYKCGLGSFYLLSQGHIWDFSCLCQSLVTEWTVCKRGRVNVCWIMGLFLHQSNQKWRTPSTPGLSGAVFSLQAVLYLWSQIILHRSPPSPWAGRRRPSIYNRRHIPENLQYFYFSQWCSDVSQWRNCVRVKHLQWFQLEVNIDLFFFIFLFLYCSWWLW